MWTSISETLSKAALANTPELVFELIAAVTFRIAYQIPNPGIGDGKSKSKCGKPTELPRHGGLVPIRSQDSIIIVSLFIKDSRSDTRSLKRSRFAFLDLLRRLSHIRNLSIEPECGRLHSREQIESRRNWFPIYHFGQQQDKRLVRRRECYRLSRYLHWSSSSPAAPPSKGRLQCTPHYRTGADKV